MKITILGCGGSGGVPLVGGDDGQGNWGICDPLEQKNQRTRSSIVIELNNGKKILIDSGPDIRTQLLREKIGRVDAVIYSHAHADHIAGLDELRSINRVLGKALPIYATKDTLSELKSRFAYAFKPWKTQPYFFRPVLDVHQIDYYDNFMIENQSIQTCEQVHGFCKSMGIRCGDVAYCTDVVRIPEQGLKILSNLDLFIVGCFQRNEHPAHAWIGKVLEWKKIIKPKRTILTHMGPDMDWNWLKANLPPDIEVAYDGLILYSS